ncbi:Copper-transporting ATPase paa2, chloroplastic [Dionaea muscipula]
MGRLDTLDRRYTQFRADSLRASNSMARIQADQATQQSRIHSLSVAQAQMGNILTEYPLPDTIVIRPGKTIVLGLLARHSRCSSGAIVPSSSSIITAMAATILKPPLSPHSTLNSSSGRHRCRFNTHSSLRALPSPLLAFLSHRRDRIVPKAVEINKSTGILETHEEGRRSDFSILLDVTGMMCGSCVSRVKTVLCADGRVESVVVNILTETAAIRLRGPGKDGESLDDVAERLARRLTECGFEAKQRVSGNGMGERVRKWKEMAGKKEALLEKSRNRVIFAWTLVALCCGSHASHILHSLGIHIAHGGLWDFLHNSCVKAGLALGALLGPGRDLLYDGLKAFVKGSPNMNSLVGFGSITAFTISAVTLLNLGLDWDGSFFDEPIGMEASTPFAPQRVFFCSSCSSILFFADDDSLVAEMNMVTVDFVL